MAAQRPIGFWLKLVDQLITEQFDASMEEHGVTRRQWQLMNLLAETPSTAVGLAEALAPSFGEASVDVTLEHLGELAESGWVEAEGEGEAYALTDKGRTSLATLTEIVERNRETITADIPVQEYEATLDVLQRMAGNLGWTG